MSDDKKLEDQASKKEMDSAPPGSKTSDLSFKEEGDQRVLDKRVWTSRKRLEELKKKAQSSEFYLDHLQRLQAEFDNFRKRNVKEREDFRKLVLEDFLIELVEVLDNFERALESSKENQNFENFRTGVNMIYHQFQDCLSRRGITVIEASGQIFDPLKHDAVSYEDSSHSPHQVIHQLSRGYSLHGKVIRPSRVKVSKESPPSEKDASSTVDPSSPKNNDCKEGEAGKNS
ncbi:MAG: nucleotide exchange factor GrpE [Chlamydiae bacterium]|nr:nucleotide exchange factor GrpE [Chlamydiota bacterium]MBI3276444.1 nucleotide exchange factor GrpE [Chlamydiota bacterium]